MWDLISPVTLTALGLGLIAMTTAKVFEPAIKGGKHGSAARWFAFVLSLIAGLLLAVFLIPLTAWVGKLGGLGVVAASVGTVITVLMGWQAVYLIIAAIRDLMDKTPDEEARKAARWVPTFLPAGGSAVATLVSNPRASGFGLGVSVLTAAIVSAITVAYTLKICKAVDAAKAGKSGWKWFAAAICFLAGVVHIALITYLDGIVADFIPGAYMAGLRILLGAAGLGLLIAGFVDYFKDGVPDQYVRRAGWIGIPLVTLFASAAISAISDNANSTMQLLAAGGIG
jgi:hypothetical protein